MAGLGPDKAFFVTDPVCGKELALEHAMAQAEYEDWAYFFCTTTICLRAGAILLSVSECEKMTLPTAAAL